MTNRHDFATYISRQSLQSDIHELAWYMVEAHSQGVDIKPYIELIEGLGQRIGSAIGGGIGHAGDWLTKNFGQGGQSVVKGIGRAGNAAISGLGGGVIQGAKRGMRGLMHGQGANDTSFQLKDAIKLISNAIKSSNPQVANSLQQIVQQLQQQMQVSQMNPETAATTSPAAQAMAGMDQTGSQRAMEPEAQMANMDRGNASPGAGAIPYQSKHGGDVGMMTNQPGTPADQSQTPMPPQRYRTIAPVAASAPNRRPQMRRGSYRPPAGVGY